MVGDVYLGTYIVFKVIGCLRLFEGKYREGKIFWELSFEVFYLLRLGRWGISRGYRGVVSETGGEIRERDVLEVKWREF